MVRLQDTEPDTKVADLPSLGPKSAAWIAKANIHTLGDIQALGPVEAYRRTVAAGAQPNLNLLWGIYAASQNMDWRQISAEEKSALLLELDQWLG